MRKIDAPWGRMKVWVQTSRFWIKTIHVKEGHRTSLQFHRERSELHIRFARWYQWEIGLVAPRMVHRMGPGKYLEIAWGHPAESDIIRMADDYGRNFTKEKCDGSPHSTDR